MLQEGGDFEDSEINQDVEKMELEERRDVIANKIRELELPVDSDGCIPFGLVLLAVNKNAYGNLENLELDAGNPRDIEILAKILKREKKAKTIILKREVINVVFAFKIVCFKIQQSRKMRKGKKSGQAGYSLRNANPFVTIMQTKMTFLALKRYTEDNWTRIQYHRKMGMSLRSIDPSSSSEDSSSSACEENLSEEKGVSTFLEKVSFSRIENGKNALELENS